MATDTQTTQNQNIWFGISMGLMGLIMGFVIATLVNYPSPVKTGAPQAQASSVPNAPVPQAPAAVTPIDMKRDHIAGNKNAKIALIEYSDFECPFCHKVEPTYKQIMQVYGDQIMRVYRHFPLTQLHAKAFPAAVASECVYELGGDDAFWKFSDEIYGNANYDFEGIAKGLDLDIEKFTACAASGKYDAYINQQMADGTAAGINGTPGNILYNIETKEARVIPGARTFEMFKTDIDAMLANQ